jgi:molybdopterin-guanine dinucleotide biosynthesis protein A
MGREPAADPPSGVSAVVLAGGQSRRLGVDKSLLLLEGRPLLVRTLDRLAPISEDLIVVTNHPRRYEHLGLAARLVPDERPGVGSLMGIYSGLKAAHHGHALVVACDMPFLSLPLLRHLLALAPGYDVVIPRLGDDVEPLHAVYGKACLPAMERVLAQGRRRIVAFFDDVRVRYVTAAEIAPLDPQHLSFVNVNTPQDWEQVQALGAERRA